ncbi:unnamed protein product [Lathyrus sativus]|nr:unnamed protein product [Lathyrus sativus]
MNGVVFENCSIVFVEYGRLSYRSFAEFFVCSICCGKKLAHGFSIGKVGFILLAFWNVEDIALLLLGCTSYGFDIFVCILRFCKRFWILVFGMEYF